MTSMRRMDWDERRGYRVRVNLEALTEVQLMMLGLSRDAEGFAELERRVEQKQKDLRALQDLWKSGQ